MRDEFGERVTAVVIKDASHALFPEQPDALAEAVLAWAAPYQKTGSGYASVATDTDLTEIRRQRQQWKEAFEAGDIDRIMSFYAPGAETVAFDILPPLQFAGSDAYKADWAGFLRLFDGPIAVETNDITITSSGEVCFIHGLVHITSTMHGKPLSLWMRATNGLRKIDGTWTVVHDHVSIPVDIATGRSCMKLIP